MGKIAFVFAGQGAQYSGMGLGMAQSFEASNEVFKALDAIRPHTSEQCFFGSEETLRETKNTQPCIFAVEMSCAAALSQHGIYANMVAGFSVGELAALTYSGAMDLQTGFSLVCRRGELMRQAAEQQPAAMAAVLRLSNNEVERICAGFSKIYPVNYNCPGQISVSGAEDEMPSFILAVKAAGGRAIPINVKGGFHSPFMKPAAEAFSLEIEKLSFSIPSVPVYSNYTGKPYSESIRELLSMQIFSPVRWEQSIRNMIEAGADTFLELGPGHTLSGLISKIDPDVRTFSISDQSGLDTVLSEVKQC
ncbi:MAG: ACP S-malonyltransferase [Clostridiaceae bacterium]|nr:ACP S-malonyltransferase [Clostridiaceae bacterium]